MKSNRPRLSLGENETREYLISRGCKPIKSADEVTGPVYYVVEDVLKNGHRLPASYVEIKEPVSLSPTRDNGRLTLSYSGDVSYWALLPDGRKVQAPPIFVSDLTVKPENLMLSYC